jgi:hypothetical protein
VSDYGSPDSFGLGEAAVELAVQQALTAQFATMFPVSLAMPCFAAAPPSGWIFLQGQATPVDAPELLAFYGPTLPDGQGRGLVGVGPHADVNAVGANDGLPAAQRTPKHNSTKNGGVGLTGSIDGGSVDAFNPNAGSGTVGAPPGSGDRSIQHLAVDNGSLGVADTITVGPGGARPVDTIAYMAVNWAVPHR